MSVTSAVTQYPQASQASLLKVICALEHLPTDEHSACETAGSFTWGHDRHGAGDGAFHRGEIDPDCRKVLNLNHPRRGQGFSSAA